MSEVLAEIRPIEEILKQDLSIPNYQRPYRWSEKNVLQLLEDIFSSWQQVKSAYRIGSLIVHNDSENKQLSIVDGQQRITTIILILHALESDLADNLINRLKYNHTDSEVNIRSNHLFIKQWVKENLQNQETEFLKYLSKFCQFVEVKVNDLSEAFQMFDSQNSRGKSLEHYNLLKAFHIRAMEDNTEKDRMECDRRWENATRFKHDPLKDGDSKDILKQIFNEQLYRTRLWSRKQKAFHFNKSKIEEFKGVSISKQEQVKHPFQNNSLLQYVAQNYFNTLNVEVKGIKSRFLLKNLSNVSPFTSLNQPVINGKAFFDYIETYVEIYKQIFIHTEDTTCLEEFKLFFEKQCNYPKSHRLGDQYLKELYKSLIVLLFDRFGEEGVNEYYKYFYAQVYRLRLEKQQVRYRAVAKYPSEKQLFNILENAKSLFDLRKIVELAREDIICFKMEGVILKFMSDMEIKVKSGNSNVNLSEYNF
jgi:hypothetical protein